MRALAHQRAHRRAPVHGITLSKKLSVVPPSPPTPPHTIGHIAPPTALHALTRQAEGLWQTLDALRPGISVEVVPTLDSTNTELMRRARAGQPYPVLLVAAEQTAGKGRRGRQWVSTPGDSLTFSLGLPLVPQDWSGLSLAVGVSLAETLHPQVQLKWPNDLWWQGRKLGGILVETASIGAERYAVIGVGLNVQAPSSLPWHTGEPIDTTLPNPVPPAGLRELGGTCATHDTGAWLAALAPALLRDVLLFEQQGLAPFVPRFAARDALRGLAVQLSDGQSGTAVGIGPDGTLWLETAQGRIPVTSAEVSVRPC